MFSKTGAKISHSKNQMLQKSYIKGQEIHLPVYKCFCIGDVWGDNAATEERSKKLNIEHGENV